MKPICPSSHTNYTILTLQIAVLIVDTDLDIENKVLSFPLFKYISRRKVTKNFLIMQIYV